ncbi:hypothetical protein [Archangium sp.]|uniref:hypothetical protein n=1 Tax=Archangium sp. TaxID=1872627 RepID=UPI00286A150C|nr:hypothetical protein [Archangium sp.]
MFARLLRGTVGIAALAPLALAVLSAPALGQPWRPSISWNTYLGRQGALDGGTGGSSDTNELVKSVPTNALGEVFAAGDSFASSANADAFVSKFNADGGLAWTRMFGGLASDFVNWAVLAPSSSTLYVVGTTESSTISLIGTQDNLQTKGTHHIGSKDAFVARVNRDGQLTAFVYLGGPGDDRGYALAVDPSDENKVYVVGKTASLSFPGTNGGGPKAAGNGFVSLVDVSKTEPIIWSRYLGSASADFEIEEANKVVVQGGSLYLGGLVLGEVEGFPSTSSSSPQGNQEGFVAKLSTSGSFEWIAYLGGSEDDAVTDVLARPDGGLVVVGTTSSTNFPTPGSSSEGAFVLRMNEQGTPEGTGLRLGNGGVEVDKTSAAMDSLGNVFIGGKTSSTSFPFRVNGFDNTLDSTADGFILMVDAKVENVLWSSYVGGSSSEDWVRGVSAGPRGQLTLGGGSFSADLLKPGIIGHDLSWNGGRDGFVFRLEVDSSDPLVGGVDAGVSPQGRLTPSWEGFSDPQTGIMDYAWALTSGGGLDGGVLESDFQSVGTERFVSPADGFQLAEGKTYFVTVRASNAVGRTSTATSGGVQWGSGNGTDSDPVDPKSPFGFGCGSTGGGGLVGSLGLVALALLLVRHARRAPGSER